MEPDFTLSENISRFGCVMIVTRMHYELVLHRRQYCSSSHSLIGPFVATDYRLWQHGASFLRLTTATAPNVVSSSSCLDHLISTLDYPQRLQSRLWYGT